MLIFMLFGGDRMNSREKADHMADEIIGLLNSINLIELHSDNKNQKRENK